MTTAQQIAFGVGFLTVIRTDIAVATPVPLGILQDVDMGFKFSNKKLYGQYQLQVDEARGSEELTIKTKFARVYSGAFDLFFGQGVTPAAGIQIASNEPHTVAATTQQVTNHTTFIDDLGVYYAASGIQLTKVAAGSEATGKYSVAPSTGTYTFAAGDEVALLFNYSYGVTTMNQLVLTNQLMGSQPTFKAYMSLLYKGNYANYVFNQVTSDSLDNPFKNQDYMVNGFNMSIAADAANNIGSLSFSQ